MHSLNHAVMGHAVAAERARPASRAQHAQRRHRPPPARSRAAVLAARAARRLDADAARRIVA